VGGISDKFDVGDISERFGVSATTSLTITQPHVYMCVHEITCSYQPSISDRIGVGSISDRFGVGDISDRFGLGDISDMFGVVDISDRFGVGDISDRFGVGDTSDSFGVGDIPIALAWRTWAGFVTRHSPPTLATACHTICQTKFPSCYNVEFSLPQRVEQDIQRHAARMMGGLSKVLLAFRIFSTKCHRVRETEGKLLRVCGSWWCGHPTR